MSQQPLTSFQVEWSDFIESLNAEFFSTKGYGVYAFLSFDHIKLLYDQLLGNPVPVKAFIKVFVRNFK
ncbi:MAG: hypothetical protein Q7U98_19040 [Methylicorpusculum sp.]|uniref:hypothetical protein n=1 Tax=Methylicorpusculum sp. TaxID=2713644 RepID=UPI00271DC563|nr:hypothetical protein [Methylicorpusculum sp.]MDO8845192.1 hypothetical protein [Methylicorpusculum sp.]MDO8941255.1 hypothetical protein [Methylicorpusculum sp.]MDO9239243.1 hypothetical protein [Methylicorpusculum sp.]MDP2201059.1 hypothetical protein [Methylicorpusculum sp.]